MQILSPGIYAWERFDLLRTLKSQNTQQLSAPSLGEEVGDRNVKTKYDHFPAIVIAAFTPSTAELVMPPA